MNYPQGNGQAEATNKAIFSNIKKNLQEAKGKWLEELSTIVWAHRTTERRSTGITPFAMVYGSEAVIPTLLSEVVRDAPLNERQLSHNTDLLEETRNMALVHLPSYNQQARSFYAKKVSV
ncbi:Ribonuclease H-like domain containing protein [Parasponia andersonii]|uniref:Ribonuclease H-like domain containing protein n=1 Tax=Parasponia andersonii TaxID=3476 RepID=A0A2P5ABX6_PARAD|nr:Ribonuclease H-like domain containing protein [Parasponia andersonii]